MAEKIIYYYYYWSAQMTKHTITAAMENCNTLTLTLYIKKKTSQAPQECMDTCYQTIK